MATIYRKTAKGQHEVETRALKLAPKFRGMLIMIDGKRSDEELRRMLPQADDNVLEALAAGGFVEAIAVTADPKSSRASSAPAAAPAPATDASPPPGAGTDLASRKRDAVAALTEMIGPMADVPAMKIESAQTPEEFRAAVETAIRFITNVRGRLAASDFARHFLEG